ncbi:MAG: ankyrin repeat domain-containing protein [Rhodomicrobium sp.]
MTRYRLFGDQTALTEDTKLIMAEDLEALARRIGEGWNIDAPMQVTVYSRELPINIALIEDKLRVADFLLERGADLNVEGCPAIVAAASNCKAETLRKLAAHGAKIDAVDNVGKNAYSAALYSDRHDLLPVIAELGLKVEADGGCVFRQAVFHRQYRAVEFFIAQGIDVNLHAPDQVFPNNPTAVAVAAAYGELPMVKLLVEHGADVLLTDAYGFRPYLEASTHGHAEVQAYLKNLEPAELHDEELRAKALAGEGVPAALIELLRSDDRRMELGNSIVGGIRFHPVTDVPETNWQGRRFFDLLAEADNYSARGLLVWSPANGKLAFADFEHEEFHVLCTWEEFIADPGKWLDRLF